MNFPQSSFTHYKIALGKCRLGIDEAGRGPVMGPMVYAAAWCPLDRDLSEFGFADSKTLKANDRDRLFKELDATEWLGWAVSSISAVEISAKMLQRQRISLNEIAHNATIDLISHVLAAGVELHEIYVDTVGPPDKYQAKLSALFPGISITVAKKADSIYPIVSAASICAKVTRDQCLANFKFDDIDANHNYGSGYPSDPAVVKWLKDNAHPVFGYPSIVRFSWSTAELAMEKHCYGVNWGDDENKDPRQSKLSFEHSKENDLMESKGGVAMRALGFKPFVIAQG